jgi:hypothetical protein
MNMSIHLILTMGSLLLMTIIPVAMFFKKWGTVPRTALIVTWVLAVGTVYIYVSVLFLLAD